MPKPNWRHALSKSEEWRPVVGFENYQVSNKGIVRGQRGVKKPFFGWYGYLKVELWKDGKSKLRPVHQLVIEAFTGPRPKGYQCAHLDGDKYNNTPENLKWRRGGEGIGNANLTNAQAEEIRRRYVRGKNRSNPGNAKLLAEEFGVSKSTILHVTRGDVYAR